MRIPARRLHEYPWYVRLAFRNQQRRFGQLLQPGLLWGRSPKLLFAFAAFYRALDRADSPLTPALRSLVMVRVSQINHCVFCTDLNAALLARRAGSMDKVAALDRWRDSKLLDEHERAALEYAEAMTRDVATVSDELVERLRKLFDDDAVVELTALIAFQNLSSRFNSALSVPAQGFCLPSARPKAETTPSGDPELGGAQ